MTEPAIPSAPKCERCHDRLEPCRSLDDEGNVCEWKCCECDVDVPSDGEDSLASDLPPPDRASTAMGWIKNRSKELEEIRPTGTQTAFFIVAITEYLDTFYPPHD